MDEIAVGVGIGGSATLRAVRWAAERASHERARLSLVHVLDETNLAGADDEMRTTATALAEERLAQAAEVARAVDDSLEIEESLLFGSPGDVFADISKQVSFLVIGSEWQGESRANRRRVQSLRIAAASDAPVAVIPDLDVGDRRGVAVGIDGSHASDRAISFAADEASRLGEPLIAVHAWDIVALTGGDYGYGAVPVLATDDLERSAAAVLAQSLDPLIERHPELEIEREIVAGDPVHVLAEVAARATLLVVGSHGRGALARFLLGSVSHGVLARLETPTVVIR
jgi:nucleotide-binding universal stress UspA family protein